MLKFLVFILLVVAVVAYLVLRRTPKRPPRDWGRGGDDGGPVLPTSYIGLDASRKPANDASSGDDRAPANADAGGSDGGGGGSD